MLFDDDGVVKRTSRAVSNFVDSQSSRTKFVLAVVSVVVLAIVVFNVFG